MNRDIELAKKLLESKGYRISRLSEGSLVPDENGKIVLGTLNTKGKSAQAIDFKSLTEEDEGREVYILRHETQYGDWDEYDEREKINADYLIKGTITHVSVTEPSTGVWARSGYVSVYVTLSNGEELYYSNRDFSFGNNVFYDERNAQKLVDMSNKRKGIDKAEASMSETTGKDLVARAGFSQESKEFNSPDYGEDARIQVGCRATSDGKQAIVYCYISPAGGGHVNHGSTIEVGYTFVNGRLKRHYGAFDMPLKRGWMDNKDTTTTSLNQFDKDVNTMKQIINNPEQYSVKDIVNMLK